MQIYTKAKKSQMYGFRSAEKDLSSVRGEHEIVVFSDSHGRTGFMKEVLSAHPRADVIHLGDGVRDLDLLDLSGRAVICVAGNHEMPFENYRIPGCEDLPDLLVLDLHGTLTYVTHGAVEGVKYGYERLCQRADRFGCALALFGHTHHVCDEYLPHGLQAVSDTDAHPLRLFNPGTAGLGHPHSCGILTFRNGVLLTSHFTG